MTILPLFQCHLVVGESDCAFADWKPRESMAAKARLKSFNFFIDCCFLFQFHTCESSVII